MIEAVGETRVGMGSDFDGALIPAAIGDASGLPVLFEAMRRHGYDDAAADTHCAGQLAVAAGAHHRLIQPDRREL